MLTTRIDSLRVSANHLLLVCTDEGEVSLYETHSRNGTSLRLAAGQPVQLQGDVALDLAPRGGTTTGIGEPRPADWSDEGDFGSSVLEAINGGLGHRLSTCAPSCEHPANRTAMAGRSTWPTIMSCGLDR